MSPRRKNFLSKAENFDMKSDMSVLDLPDLVLECILEKLPPEGLCKMTCVCTYLRERCMSDHHWEKHMKNKWARIVGPAAYREWQRHIASRKVTRSRANNLSKKKNLPQVDSIMSWYIALESGKFWFPAQVCNRENGNDGFLLSCYDSKLSYDQQTDTFQARYPSHGRRASVLEAGVTWDRLRAPPVDTSPHEHHISECLNDLQPGDHIEVQWRINKKCPYGWWYGVVGHLETCYLDANHCQCQNSEMLQEEFSKRTAARKAQKARLQALAEQRTKARQEENANRMSMGEASATGPEIRDPAPATPVPSQSEEAEDEVPLSRRKRKATQEPETVLLSDAEERRLADVPETGSKEAAQSTMRPPAFLHGSTAVKLTAIQSLATAEERAFLNSKEPNAKVAAGVSLAYTGLCMLASALENLQGEVQTGTSRAQEFTETITRLQTELEKANASHHTEVEVLKKAQEESRAESSRVQEVLKHQLVEAEERYLLSREESNRTLEELIRTRAEADVAHRMVREATTALEEQKKTESGWKDSFLASKEFETTVLDKSFDFFSQGFDLCAAQFEEAGLHQEGVPDLDRAIATLLSKPVATVEIVPEPVALE